MNIKDILGFRLRLRLKNSVKKLKGDRQEEYFDNLRALNTIDPYRYLLVVVVLVTSLAVFVSYSWAVFLLSVYTLWIVFYGITFLGVSYMYRDSLKKQEFEDDVLRKKV